MKRTPCTFPILPCFVARASWEKADANSLIVHETKSLFLLQQKETLAINVI
jgi:hypothetical protein